MLRFVQNPTKFASLHVQPIKVQSQIQYGIPPLLWLKLLLSWLLIQRPNSDL